MKPVFSTDTLCAAPKCMEPAVRGGRCMRHAKPVTGPDGDNPITDAQLNELHELAAALITDCNTARDTSRSGAGRRAAALARCAEIINARQTGGAK